MSMATNDEIIRGNVPCYITDNVSLFITEIQRGETDYIGMLNRLALIIDNEARADQFCKDTDERVQSINEVRAEGYKEGQKDKAKEIFDELDAILLTDNPKRRLSPITYGAYQAIKKKHKVDLKLSELRLKKDIELMYKIQALK